MVRRDDPFRGDFDEHPAWEEWQRGPELEHEVTTGTDRGFDGHFIHVRVDDVRLASGRTSRREVVEHPGSAVIIPLTVDRQVLLVRQWRHVTGRYQLELPAGVVDPNEQVLETAARELVEETGYEAGALRHLTTVYVTPGYSQERAALILATECQPVDRDVDIDEPIELIYRSLDELPGLLEPGNTAVENAASMLGLLWLLRLDALGEI